MDTQPQESSSLINLAIVLNDKGEVLVVRRAEKQIGADQSVLEWAFPGGKQRLNESRKESVERETLDETGYKIIAQKEISMRSPRQFPIILIYHLCRLAQPDPVSPPQQPWEISEIKWVKPEELKNLFTTDINLNVAKELGI